MTQKNTGRIQRKVLHSLATTAFPAFLNTRSEMICLSWTFANQENCQGSDGKAPLGTDHFQPHLESLQGCFQCFAAQKMGAESQPNAEGRSSPRLTVPRQESWTEKTSVIDYSGFLLGGKESSQLTFKILWWNQSYRMRDLPPAFPILNN